MSKRFVDYYLEAVTKKSGGGGGYPEPTGTINITSNGTHNVKDKATANVNVPQPSLGPLSGFIHSNGAVDFFPSDYGYDAFDAVSITADVPSGGGGAEIIIPDNSLGAYIEGTGDPMDAQSVVNWYDMFDPTYPVPCTFQGATPNIDDRVLLTGDVLSSVDFATVVGRYAIWGVCGSSYDGVGITFSEALGYSAVDPESPANSPTKLTESEAYTNESGSQQITVDVQGGGGSDDMYEFDEVLPNYSGWITLNPQIPSGKTIKGVLAFANDYETFMSIQTARSVVYDLIYKDPDTSGNYYMCAGYKNTATATTVTGNVQNTTYTNRSNQAANRVIYLDASGTSFDYHVKAQTETATIYGLLGGRSYHFIVFYE